MTTALTSSNGTGMVVVTDDGWLNGIGVGVEMRFERQMIRHLGCLRT